MSLFASVSKPGCSVTRRIKQIKQPRGGYIKPKDFMVTSLGDGIDALHPEENIHPSLIGLSVDYLSRYMAGASEMEAFRISHAGARIIGEDRLAEDLLREINGLDDRSIINAIKLSGFDVCLRSGPMGYKPIEEINPDQDTIENVRTMVERSLDFFEQYASEVIEGFTFEGGYTSVVSSGDGDFMTRDTLWDFKVSKMSIKKEHTLQLLMYWRMGLHSVHPEFKQIEYLGIFNPRLNQVYRLAVKDIPEDIIQIVEIDVIGYKG